MANVQHKVEKLHVDDSFIRDSSIGDLMRGARATLGLNDLRPIEKELKIKMRVLRAIEDVDPTELPSQAYLAGYVRAYARHLSAELPLSPDAAYEKFQAELQIKIEALGTKAEPGEAPPPNRLLATQSTIVATTRLEHISKPPAEDAAPAGAKMGADKIGAKKEVGPAAGARVRLPRTPPLKTDGESAVPAPQNTREKGRDNSQKSPETTQTSARDAAPAPRRIEPLRPIGSTPPRESGAAQVAGFAILGAVAFVGLGAVAGVGYGVWSLVAEAQRVIAPAPSELRVVERWDGGGSADALSRPAADFYDDLSGYAPERAAHAPAAAAADARPELATPTAALAAQRESAASAARPPDLAPSAGWTDAPTAAAGGASANRPVLERPPVGGPQSDWARVQERAQTAALDDPRRLDQSVDQSLLERTPLVRRDGPIVELDPSRQGAFASAFEERLDPRADALTDGDRAAEASVETALPRPSPLLDRLTAAVETAASADAPAAPDIALRTTGEAWLKVVDASGDVVFMGLAEPERLIALPPDLTAFSVRTGNAGDTYLVADGVAYGPLGARGGVTTIGIEIDAIAEAWPNAVDLTQRLARERLESLAALEAVIAAPTEAAGEAVRDPSADAERAETQ